MSAFYQTFTSLRTTDPDPTTLLANLRALDASAGVQHEGGSTIYRIKKSTAWLPAHITAVQPVIDNCVASSPQLTARAHILAWPIEYRAMALAIMDWNNDLQTQINACRALLPNPPAPRAMTIDQQVLDAIVARTSTLT